MTRSKAPRLFITTDPPSGVMSPCIYPERKTWRIGTLPDGFKLQASIEGKWRLLQFDQTGSTTELAAFVALDGRKPSKLRLGPEAELRWPKLRGAA